VYDRMATEKTSFKRSDDVLKQPVTARREEVVRLQKSQAVYLEDLETRGQARLAALRETLPTEMVAVRDSLSKTHDAAKTVSKSYACKVKAKLAASGPSPENKQSEPGTH
jgi:hypothetical protein